ncbi:MAG: 2TM domain-containing protein [Myxococcota bacterium]
MVTAPPVRTGRTRRGTAVARQYSGDEMEAIVRRALERGSRDEPFTHEDLLSAAAEIGIPPDEVEAAAAEVELERDRRRWEQAARDRRRRRFFGRLGTFVGLNGVLFAIDALTGAGWWVHWVIMGTGVPVSLQALRLYRPVQEREVERERRREEREQRRRARDLRRRRRQRNPAEEFEVVVERGVELLLDALASRGQTHGRRSQAPPSAPPGPRVRVEAEDEGRSDPGEAPPDEARAGRRRGSSGTA